MQIGIHSSMNNKQACQVTKQERIRRQQGEWRPRDCGYQLNSVQYSQRAGA